MKQNFPSGSRCFSFVGLLLALLLQLAWHHQQTLKKPQRRYLPAPPSYGTLKVAAMGEPEVLARIIMLWLQSFDVQPGVDVPFKALNYSRLIQWLEIVCQLDEKSQYGLFSAAYVYTNVPDEQRLRQILQFIEARFQQRPERYWRWLAHAAILARHRLHDNNLALRYARLLRRKTQATQAPAWARQMEIGILEAQGEYESARLLIGGLLHEAYRFDAHELAYLNYRLKALKARRRTMDGFNRQ